MIAREKKDRPAAPPVDSETISGTSAEKSVKLRCSENIQQNCYGGRQIPPPPSFIQGPGAYQALHPMAGLLFKDQARECDDYSPRTEQNSP